MDPRVQGAVVDDQTRCEHWSSPRDIVAFRFECCGEWYPCRTCHDQATDHDAQVWGPEERGEHAVLCGVCRTTMTIDAYVTCEHTCPSCEAAFNPGCQKHWDRYFKTL